MLILRTIPFLPNMPIQIRIFIGFLLNKEMRMHLKQSAAWSEAKMLGNPDLTEAQDHDKEYIGRFVSSPVSCSELKKMESEIKSQLHLYCPKLNLDKQRSYLISQLFFL